MKMIFYNFFQSECHENKAIFISYKGDIQMAEQFAASVEDYEYCLDDLIQAVAALVATLYVFNIAS